jgi:hypothetical protein
MKHQYGDGEDISGYESEKQTLKAALARLHLPCYIFQVTKLLFGIKKHRKPGIHMDTNEGRLKSSWPGGSTSLLYLLLHNSGALPPVHELFKQPS